MSLFRMFQVIMVVMVKNAGFGAMIQCNLSVSNCVLYVLLEFV